MILANPFDKNFALYSDNALNKVAKIVLNDTKATIMDYHMVSDKQILYKV